MALGFSSHDSVTIQLFPPVSSLVSQVPGAELLCLGGCPLPTDVSYTLWCGVIRSREPLELPDESPET